MASKNFLVSTADVAFFYNDMLAFTGTTALNTSLSVTMEDEEITGGKMDKTLYKYKYGRKLSATIEMAEWNLAYIASQVGTGIFEGLRDVYKIHECVTLTEGVGTLEEEPVGNVFIEFADGSIMEVVPVGNTIEVETEDESIYATYQFSTDVRRVTIDADSTPYVGRLVMSAEKHNNLKGMVGEVQIEIPSFQLNGTFDISLESTGAATTSMEGDALAVEGVTCADGTVYAYVTELGNDATQVSVKDIAATTVSELVVGATSSISIVGIKGGLYANVGIEASDCEFAVDDSSIATVDSDGTITGISAGTTMIHVTYGSIEDILSITVVEE